MSRFVVYLAASCLAVLPVSTRACDLALVLAVDVSASVSPAEYDIQMRGLAEALRDGTVSEALVRAEAEIALVQWSGSGRQALSVPWRRVSDFDALDQLADDIENTRRRWRNYSTAIGEMLGFSLDLFQDVPDCRRRVIDVSGDGSSNEGPEPEALRAALVQGRVTVNALAIEGSEAGLTSYFRDHVILGEGAFVIAANSFADYPDRIQRKLVREVVEKYSQIETDDLSATPGQL